MPKARKPSDLLPSWSKYETTDSKGRDPLGLSRVSHVITDQLLNGVITTTDRARYYSFYIWCLWHIAQHERPSRGPAFVEAFQRRESAMVIATLLYDPEASVVGKLGAASVQAMVTGARATVETQFRCLPASRLGGYGQYYRGCIYDLALRDTTEEGIDRAAGEAAAALAEAFHSIVKDTPYIKKGLFVTADVPILDLQNSASQYGLQSLDDDVAEDERRLLADLLWNDGPRALDNSHRKAWNRRETLALMFTNLEAYRKAKIPVHVDECDWQLLIAPCYYGQLIELADDGISTETYVQSEQLADCSELWAQFVLHYFVTLAFEYALQSMVLIVGWDEGLELSEVRAKLIQAGLIKHMASLCKTKAERPADLVRWSEKDARTLCDFGHPRCEYNLIRHQDENPDAVSGMAVGLALMATISIRWSGSSAEGPVRLIGERCVANNLWLGSVLELTRAWSSDSASWEDAVDAVLRLLVNTHERVMNEKHSLDACWIQRDGKRYRAKQKVLPQMRASRWRQTLRICEDLKLVAVTDGCLTTTNLGRKRLAAVMGVKP